MCLSGVDYFSTLGYQPGIAVLAAGALAPVATLVLVAVTLFGVVPVYRLVAKHSPHGLGSIALMEKLVCGWKGKVIVLVLLGFAMTDFIITITLSAADASAHLLHSSSSPWQLWVTLVLLAALAGVFLRGFNEAVTVAVALVTVYVGMTAAVLVGAAHRIITHPEVWSAWHAALDLRSTNPWLLLGLALIVFPKLALGMSGFEAGVSVMPLIKASSPTQRIKNGQRLLLTSALIMSTMLVLSSFAVTLLVPQSALAAGGPANGRALAYLAHDMYGAGFGHVYDYSTVAILWFAGASAMSGLLALIPRYLPRYGMAPAWAQRSRPMVGVLAAIAVLVTVLFGASVDAQAGAYATGVLVVLASGALAVTLLAKGRQRIAFAITTVVLTVTLVANVIERPDGIRVAAWFIVGIMVASFASRAYRAFTMRDVSVKVVDSAKAIIKDHIADGEISLVPTTANSVLKDKERRIRRLNHLRDERLIFVEIELRDPSQYAEPIMIKGEHRGGQDVLSVRASSIPNAVAIIACEIQKRSAVVPDIYYEWSPGNPLKEMLRFIFVGDGQNATVTREMLRRAFPDEKTRPRVHLC